MFDKLKKKKYQRKVDTPEVADTKIRILSYHKRRFVVGLQWEPVRKTVNIMKEVRRIGKERNLDVVAIRKSDSYQAGFAPKTKHKLRGSYSLIVTLATLLDGCCIAVIPLGINEKGEEEFTLIGKTEKGGIHPFSDELYFRDQLNQVVVDLKSELRGNQSGLDIPVYGDPEIFSWVTHLLDLDDILTPKNLTSDFKLKPLTLGMTKNQLILCAIIAGALLIAAIVMSNYQEKQDAIKRQAAATELSRIEALNKKARYQTALDKIKHPWISSPSIQNFIHSCSLLLQTVPLSLEGWIPTTVSCEQSGMKVTLSRPDNSAVTTRQVVDAVKSKYGVDTEFFYNQTSIVGFVLKNTVAENGDDPMYNIGDQLIKAISLFQAVNVEAAFSAVAIEDVKQNEYGEDLPEQDWQEYTFEVDTVVTPELIFIKDEFEGMRLNKIEYSLDQGSKTIQYKIRGSIYGVKNKGAVHGAQ